MYERIVRDISLIFKEFRVAPLWFLCNYYLGVTQIEQSKRLVLTQKCNRQAIRANVNKEVNKRSEANICHANVIQHYIFSFIVFVK